MGMHREGARALTGSGRLGVNKKGEAWIALDDLIGRRCEKHASFDFMRGWFRAGRFWAAVGPRLSVLLWYRERRGCASLFFPPPPPRLLKLARRTVVRSRSKSPLDPKSLSSSAPDPASSLLGV